MPAEEDDETEEESPRLRLSHHDDKQPNWMCEREQKETSLLVSGPNRP
jgi:hypothetical protein